MSRRVSELRERRAELRAKAAGQRAQIVAFAERYRVALLIADKSWKVARFVYRQPSLVGTVAVFLLVRRRGMKRALGAGWNIWKGYRVFKGVAGKLALIKAFAQRA
jgi:hypothetical protein